MSGYLLDIYGNTAGRTMRYIVVDPPPGEPSILEISLDATAWTMNQLCADPPPGGAFRFFEISLERHSLDDEPTIAVDHLQEGTFDF